MCRQTAFALVVGLGVITRVLAGEPVASFQGLGDLSGGLFHSQARAISADGLTVVGSSLSADGEEAFRWTSQTGMVGLGDLSGGDFHSQAFGVSSNGSIVVGFSRSSDVDSAAIEAFRWTSEAGMVGLGDLSGGDFWSRANGVSADGSVVIGSSRTGFRNEQEAFLWTRDSGMVYLGGLPSSLRSAANGISADGAVVVGCSESLAGSEAFRWSLESGLVGLPALPDLGQSFGEARGVSSDGVVAVGRSGQSPTRPVSWNGDDVVDLDGLASVGSSEALDVSADGSVIVGRSDNTAFVWDSDGGMRSLTDVLSTDYGLDVSGWMLWEANGVSDDGTTVVGWGHNPNGAPEAWIAHLRQLTIPVRPTIVRSDPPSGIIDARQDLSTSGRTPQGITQVRVRVSSTVKHLTTGSDLDATSFITQSTCHLPPVILDVVKVLDDPETVATYDVVFEDPIESGCWTTILANVARGDGRPVEPPSDRVVIGFLPADVNGSGTANAADVLELIDNLNGILDPPLADWQCDVDRSSVCGAPDVLRVIDLLNGVNTTRSWNNVSLPSKPE